MKRREIRASIAWLVMIVGVSAWCVMGVLTVNTLVHWLGE